jgi:hypothetical protein
MNPNVGLWVLLVNYPFDKSSLCEGKTQECYTTNMKSGLPKQNKSSLRIMKQDIDMYEITLSSLSLRCLFNAVTLEMG